MTFGTVLRMHLELQPINLCVHQHKGLCALMPLHTATQPEEET